MSASVNLDTPLARPLNFSPLMGVGLDTPSPQPDPSTYFPLGVGLDISHHHPHPLARPLNFPPGCGPRHPLPVDRMTDTCKNITLANFVCGR